MLIGRPFRRILGISFVCSCFLMAYFNLSDVNLEYDYDFDYECSPDKSNKSSLISNHICFEEPKVFFVETSGSAILNVRQACSVESAAKHNPSMKVYVLMTPSIPIAYKHSLIRKLNTLPNVHLLSISIDVLLHGSPLFKWYRQGKWKKSKWKVPHVSDAARLLLMWKYGGMYLDMDIVTLHSLEHLRNTAFAQDWHYVGNSILIFDKYHELIRRCMFDFANNYDPLKFAENGPGILTRNIQMHCDTKSNENVIGSTSCGINILSPAAAFPIPYEKWENYFSESSVKNVTAYFNSSYLIHVWNKLSNAFKLKVGSNSVYELAIKQNCPLSYEYAQEVGYI